MIDPVDLLLPGAFYMALALAALAVVALVARPAWAGPRTRAVLVAASAWSWIFSAPGFANLAISDLEGPVTGMPAGVERDERAMVVVLASGNLYAHRGIPLPRLDASGWERLRAGIALWRRTGGTLLLTGGPVAGNSLAERMREVALEAGIPPEAIAITPGSTNTYEDLFLSRDRIAPHSGRAWLVTSALHQPRALSVARRLGLELKPYRCDFRQLAMPTWRAWFPDDGGPALWAAVLHEWVGRVYYRMLGRAD